jgi:uncharacterized protein YjiS (DUF1127 family)
MQPSALPAARGRVGPRPGRRLQSLVAIAALRLLRWRELARQRRALLTLDDRMLKDIGITRVDAECEARRPFWSDAVGP